MMRTAWNLLSFLAVVNLLGLLMFTGWLWHSQRLDRDRLLAIRAMLAITIPDALRQAEESAKEAEAERLRDADEARLRQPPIRSEAQVAAMSRLDQQAHQVARRLFDESTLLADQLDRREQDLAARQAAFEDEKRRWEETTAADRQRAADAQFARAVKLLESLPPKAGKQKVEELVATGRTDQAVRYLNAMNQRQAAGIIKEFKTDDENRLATELLERLRTFGFEAEPAEDSPDARHGAPIQQPT
jgi:hypothetical protein